MSRRFIIDLSDLYGFLSKNSEITGIQRLLISMAAHHGSWSQNEVLLGYWNPLHRRYLAFPFPEDTFVADELRAAGSYPNIDRYAPHKHAGKPLKRFVYRRRRDLRRFWHLRVRGPILRMLPQSTINPIDFRDGDVLLSLGSGWTDGVMEMFDHVRPLANAGRVIPIVLLHDLIPFHPGTDNHPTWKVDAFEHWFQTVTSFVDRYLVYSRATEQDLSAELSKRGRSEARIARFALAHELPQSVSSETATVSDAVRDAASEPYALAVGQIQGRKNGDRLVAAWTLLRERVSSKQLPRLIFAGASQREDLLVKLDSEMEDKILFLHRPSDTDLAFLYQNALLCVHPSLFEGWGLPIGEALWHRKLCIASNVSSMPEVGGDLVDYFDPTDVHSMADALERPIADEEYRLMRESEIAAAPLRSWRDSFRLLMEAATRLVD